jgi:hypothetical protein
MGWDPVGSPLNDAGSDPNPGVGALYARIGPSILTSSEWYVDRQWQQLDPSLAGMRIIAVQLLTADHTFDITLGLSGLNFYAVQIRDTSDGNVAGVFQHVSPTGSQGWHVETAPRLIVPVPPALERSDTTVRFAIVTTQGTGAPTPGPTPPITPSVKTAWDHVGIRIYYTTP